MSESGSLSDEGSPSSSSRFEPAMSGSSWFFLESGTKETLDNPHNCQTLANIGSSSMLVGEGVVCDAIPIFRFDSHNCQTLANIGSSSMLVGEGVVCDAIPIFRSEFTADHLENNLLDSEKQLEALSFVHQHVCFGSLANFVDAQLLEIAEGLEASEKNFIWVVKKQPGEDGWLPEGFEKRDEGRGLVLRGWAPQVKILSHGVVGGLVMHCGLNSTLKAVAVGVPMVTWPIFVEQFYNEKLITQVLGIGVGVGAKEWMRVVRESVRRDEIEKAVRRAMVGKKAEEMSTRARAYGEMARRAVEVKGSSYEDLDALIQQLWSYDIA
ncbi:hypothetical protein ACFX15_034114 [Malus domestica]